MSYIFGFFRDYSGLIVPLSVAWLVARVYIPYAAKRENEQLERLARDANADNR